MLRLRQLALALLSGAAASGAAFADPPALLPAPPAPDLVAPSDAKCDLGAPGPTTRIALHVRNSRRQIGPYFVTLPGYAPVEPTAADPYTPYLVEAKPGDTLLIDLVNELDRPVNLHSHGVVTRPRPYSRPCNMPGDYIFNSAQPQHDLVYRIDIPKTVFGVGEGATPKRDGDNDADDALPFPVGVYWLHSHIHGSAKNDVWAGQSAILDIQPDASSPQLERDLAALPTQYLTLRELQLGVPPGQYPDKIDAAPSPGATVPAQTFDAQWISDKGYDTQACQDSHHDGVATAHGLGYCATNGVPAAQDGQPLDTSQDRLWLFTVNGAIGPDIAVESGQTQRWKIANLSSVVTYLLDIVPDGCAGECAETEFRIAKIDGVVTGTPATASPGDKIPTVKATRLLLPPAARAEILVVNPGNLAQDGKLILRTRGFETGGVNQDPKNYVGDPWPKVDLATVTLKKGVQAATAPAFLSKAYSVKGPSAARLQMRAMAPPAAEAIPHNCITLPDARHRRRIVLDQAADFRIGSDVVDAAGTPAGPDANGLAPSLPVIAFEHGDPPLSIPHVCAKLGSEEIWEVANRTNELHNFHLHQTKFRLATEADAKASPSALPSGFKDADAFVDPLGVISSQLQESLAPVAGVDVWHDTLPVPPATFDGAGKLIAEGRIFLKIPFFDRNQLGTYVFHCHILEHEDKGMMATIEVYDPKDPYAGGRAARYSPRPGASRLAFCGPPPADAALYAPPPSRDWLSRLFGEN